MSVQILHHAIQGPQSSVSEEGLRASFPQLKVTLVTKLSPESQSLQIFKDQPRLEVVDWGGARRAWHKDSSKNLLHHQQESTNMALGQWSPSTLQTNNERQ